jgi:shikimate kinase
MNVTLIGMKHCGKSTLGAALANRWGCPFYDVDQMIEERYACDHDQSLTVREIYRTHGEDYFRELETQVVCELYLSLQNSTAPHVIAVGGRTALNKRVDELLGALGLIVYLEVSPEEMFQRVVRGGLPPFVNEKDPVMDFLELYQERVPHYQRLANLTVNLNGLDPGAALEKLCRALENHVARGPNQTPSP